MFNTKKFTHLPEVTLFFQLEYIFSDKTGTLTENMMVFKRCTIAGTDYYPPEEGMSPAYMNRVEK